MDIRGFVRELFDLTADGLDIDGSDFEEAARKHGLIEQRALTAEQIADDAGPWHEYECKQGDPWNFRSPALIALLDKDA